MTRRKQKQMEKDKIQKTLRQYEYKEMIEHLIQTNCSEQKNYCPLCQDNI